MNKYSLPCRNKFFFMLLFALLLNACALNPSVEKTRNSPVIYSGYVPLKVGRIEYFSLGKGSPIVMLAGYGTDITSWDDTFIYDLAKTHQVIVFNNRNIGGSIVESSQYSSHDLADDTDHVMEGLHLKKSAILGVSMGGMIAQQFAVLYPTKTDELILINTAIAGHQSVHPEDSVKSMMLQMPKTKFQRYLLALRLFFPPSWKWRMAFALVRDRFKPANYVDNNPSDKTLFEQQQLIMQWAEDNATAKRIAKLPTKTLILNGESDMVIPPVNSEILKKNIAQSELIRWPEGGHAMIFQFPDEMAKEVDNFVSSKNVKRHHQS